MEVIAADIPGPGLITVFGMGTVFLCLTVLFFILSVLGGVLGGNEKSEEAGDSCAEASVEFFGEDSAPTTDQRSMLATPDSAPSPEVAAAITVALKQHRAGRGQIITPPQSAGAINPWKLSGRVRGLR